MPDDIDDVSGIGAIQNGKAGVDTDIRGEVPEYPVGNRVEST